MTPAQMQMRNKGLDSAKQFNPNFKIVEVAKKLGIKNINEMQITTRHLYHYIPLSASTQKRVLTFFENVNTVQFPYANLTNNQLQAGEAIAVERMFFTIMAVDANNPLNVLSVYNIGYLQQFNGLKRSDLDLKIDRQTVTKKINVTSFSGEFNKNSRFGATNWVQTSAAFNYNVINYDQCVFHFDNSFIIPPQIEFSADLTIPALPTLPAGAVNWFIGLNMEGLGCLFNPKANY